MFRWLVALVALWVFGAAPAVAQQGTIHTAHPACMTQDDYWQMINAVSSKDNDLLNSLIGTVCFNVKGRDYSVVEQGFGLSQVRVNVEGDWIDLWVPDAAIKAPIQGQASPNLGRGEKTFWLVLFVIGIGMAIMGVVARLIGKGEPARPPRAGAELKAGDLQVRREDKA